MARVVSFSYRDGLTLWPDLVFKGAVTSKADERRSLEWLTGSFCACGPCAEWALSLLLLNSADENLIADWALRMLEQMFHLSCKITTLKER